MTKIGPCSRQNMVLAILVFVGLITSSFSLAKFKERPVDTLVLVGDDARLNCTFDRMPELKGWAKGRLSNSISIEYRVGSRYEDDYELDASSDGSEYDLIIKNATLETTSTYFCADVFDADFNSVARVYAIAEGPSCTADPGFDVVAEENDTFICNMSLPERAPGDLVWFVDGVEMSRQQGMINEWTTSFDKTQNGTTVNCRLEHYTLPREKWSLVNCGDDIVVNVQYAPLVRIVEGDESRVIEGSTYTAQCEIVEYGNPISIEQVYWTGPTGEVYQQGDPLLSIDNVDRRDKGDYTCVMANKFKDGRDGVGMATIHVDVQYTPRVSIQDSSNATVVVGSRYEAVCLPDANPAAGVTWEFTSQDVDVELDKLVIQRVDKHHASEYTCRANNILYTGQVGQDTESIELDVQYVPELSLAITGDAATYGAVVEGNSISVDCTVDSANPEIDFLTTSFDGERWTDSQSDSHDFARIDREESGNFTCMAENTFWDGTKGRSSVDIYIDVQYWDGVTVQDVSGRRVIEGQTYSANCTVAANPQPEIFWIFADGTTSENHHLVVENASRTNEQSREFTCMANNRFWDGTPNSGYELVQVDVQYRPRVTVALTQGHAQLEDNAVTVVVGETVSLRCEIIETNPAVDSVLWIDLPELTDVYTFTAEGLQNEGQYTCQASNTFWDGTVGSDQVVISVEVQYPPKLEITDDTGFVEVEGRPYSVRCNAVGNPTPNVHWEGIEERTPNSRTLSFDSVTREMSREYRCFASNTYWDNSLGTNSTSFQLDVQYPPEISVPETVACIEGENVNISCDVIAANPENVNLKWTLANDNSHDDGGLLSLADVQRGSAGTYTCTATNSYYDGSLGVGVNRTRLDVQYPPDVSFPQDSILCKEGDNITLECHVTANPVANTVNWSKDGQVKSIGAVFDIIFVNRSDDGQYTCTAVNTFYDQTEGVGSNDINVTVEHLPDVIVGGPEEAIMEYTGTTISCGITGGLPNPYQIALMKVGQTGVEVIAISTNTSGVTELTYDVPAAKREMNGTYYCNVTTRFYDQSESYQRSENIDVIVQYPPELLDITESSIDVKLGERAELTCVVDAYPVAEVVWTDANGDVVKSEETVEGTVLTSKIILDKVDKKTLGSYHCNFANEISNGTAHEKRLGKITTPGSMEWFIDTGIIYAIIVGVIILILIIILIVCCCTRKSDKDKEMSVSDLAALKRPPADVTSKEGTENLGMVRTAPDGTVNRKGSRNETSLTTFRPQTREDIDRAERMRKLSDDV